MKHYWRSGANRSLAYHVWKKGMEELPVMFVQMSMVESSR